MTLSGDKPLPPARASLSNDKLIIFDQIGDVKNSFAAGRVVSDAVQLGTIRPDPHYSGRAMISENKGSGVGWVNLAWTTDSFHADQVQSVSVARVRNSLVSGSVSELHLTNGDRQYTLGNAGDLNVRLYYRPGTSEPSLTFDGKGWRSDAELQRAKDSLESQLKAGTLTQNDAMQKAQEAIKYIADDRQSQTVTGMIDTFARLGAPLSVMP